MDNVQQLQLLQQNMQHVVMQKQQVHSSLLEYESALEELQSTTQAYKIVGKVMIATNKEKLQKELQEKKEVAATRLEKLNAQEERLQDQMKKMQEEVMAAVKKEKNE